MQNIIQERLNLSYKPVEENFHAFADELLGFSGGKLGFLFQSVSEDRQRQVSAKTSRDRFVLESDSWVKRLKGI